MISASSLTNEGAEVEQGGEAAALTIHDLEWEREVRSYYAVPEVADVILEPPVITAETERTRMQRILDLDIQIARRKAEREDIAGQMRAQMNRDGVVRHTIPGVGTATLLPGRELKLCGDCSPQFGVASGMLDPYLKVKAV